MSFGVQSRTSQGQQPVTFQINRSVGRRPDVATGCIIACAGTNSADERHVTSGSHGYFTLTPSCKNQCISTGNNIACGHQFNQLVAADGSGHWSGVAGYRQNIAEEDIACTLYSQALAGRGCQNSVVNADVITGIHKQRTGKGQITVQLNGTGNGNGNFIVVH